MQREITDQIFLGETLDPYDDARRSTAIDSTASNFDDQGPYFDWSLR